MSSVMEKKFIDVLNCDDNVVAISSLNGKGYTFEPGSVEEPCVIPIPPEEIMYMNSTCSAFKNGVLRALKSRMKSSRLLALKVTTFCSLRILMMRF